MTRLIALVVAALSLAGCPADRSRCIRAEPAATGPGDTLALFPVATGDMWAYRVDEAGTLRRARVEVTGPASVGGRAGVRLAETTMGAPSPASGAATVAVEPGGVSVLESGELDDLAPGLDALAGPRLLLRFPVTAGDTFTSLDCQGLAAGDLDGDGRPDPIDVRSVVTVAGEEAVTLEAGSWQAIRVDTRLDVTVHSTLAGAITLVDLQQDWYVPGLGLVRSTEATSVAGDPPATATRELYAWSVGGDTVGPVTRPLDLPLGVLTAGEVAREGWQVHRAVAPAGAPLVLGLLAQSGPIGTGGASGPTAAPWWSCYDPPSLDALQCLVPAGAGEVAFEVDGGALVDPSATYAVVAAPQPSVVAPANEAATFARGEVVPGQVATRGTSSYTVTGLTPGVPVTVAMLGGTGAADLRPAPGQPLPPECWLRSWSVLPVAESCPLTPTGDTASFTVQSGPLERVGAAYLLVVW